MAEPMTYRDFSYDEGRQALLIAASLDRYDDEPAAQVSVINFNHVRPVRFGFRGLDGMRARSVVSTGETIWVVGKYGEIWTYKGKSKTPHEGQLPDSGVLSDRHLGSPNRIRLIAGRPYVCGFAGQVYTLSESGWVHMDDGVVEPEGTTTLSRLGRDPWDRPRQHLRRWLPRVPGALERPDVDTHPGPHGCLPRWGSGVCARSRRGGGERRHVHRVGRRELGRRPASRTACDAARRRRDVQGGSLRRRGRQAPRASSGHGPMGQRAHVSLEAAAEFYRLTVGDGRLWAMGSKRVHAYDGAKWEAFVDPDNG